MSIFTSQLHDEKTFYNAFVRDLSNCSKEVLIKSPAVTHFGTGIKQEICEQIEALRGM